MHALAHAINQALGNFDKTVYFTQPIEESPVNQWDSMGELAADIRAGRVTTLLILGSNPAYDAPADLGFKELLPKVPFSARLGLYEDETSALCHWHIPQAHDLESWGDARAYDGTVIGDSAADRAALRRKIRSSIFLPCSMGKPAKPVHDIVQDYWQAQRPNVDAIRCVLGEDAAGRSRRGHGVSAQSKFRSSRGIGAAAPGAALRKDSKLFSVPIPPSGTAALQTTAGCRNCPSR